MQHPVYSKIPLRISYRFPIPKATIRPPQRIKPTRVLSRTYFQKLQTSVDPRIPVSPLLTLWTLFWGEAAALRLCHGLASRGLLRPVERSSAWAPGLAGGRERRWDWKRDVGSQNGSGRLPARRKGGRAPLPREFSASKKLCSASQGVQLPLPVAMIPLTHTHTRGWLLGGPLSPTASWVLS